MKRCKLLGLDIGDRSVGVAISDATRTIARGLCNLRFQTSAVDEKVEKIVPLVETEDVGMVVIGLPLDLQGREGEQAGKVREFAAQLEQQLAVPIVFADERFTSLAATRLLYEGGLTARQQKKVKDKVAATILLQDFLNAGDFGQAQE